MNVYFEEPLNASAESLQDPFKKAVADLLRCLDDINRYDYDGVAEQEIAAVKRLWPKD